MWPWSRMTKAVFQIGSRIFRAEFMTMRSTVSAWTAPAEAKTAAAANSHRTTCRLQRRPKASGRFMAFLPSHGDNATQREHRDCGRRAERGQSHSFPPQRSWGGNEGRQAPDVPPDILALTRPARVVDFSRHNREGQMATHQTYVKTEVVGSSDKSVSDAIESAIAVASRSLRNLAWFEVIDVRGSIHNNKVANYQVTLKLGLKYEPKA